MDIRVLGPMEALRNGESLALGGPRQRTLLALLVARLPNPVDTDTLIDELWGEEASPGAKSTLQSLISNLRQALGDVIPFERGSYRLDLEPESVDAIRFARVIEAARPELAISPSATAERLREALGWWRGRPLADLVDTPAIGVYVRSLEESRLEAVELRLDAELAAGLHGSLVAELEALAEEHPFREHLRAQHMLALYRSGRQGEALRAYRKTEAILAEELGVDPSPDLQDLELSILRQDDSLLAGRAGSITQRLAILVGDMEGSAEKWDSDPSAMAEAMAVYDRIVREAVEAVGGRIAGQPGQGLLAAFPETTSAVNAAESILRGHHDAVRESLTEVRLRFGIDVGDIEAGRGTFVGPPVSRASSLCAAAHGGQVLISAAAQVDLTASAPAGVQLRQLGEHRLSGMAAAERVAQLVVAGLASDFPELRTEDPAATAGNVPISLPGYEVRERLSHRDQDELWRAYQPSVGREVAIRILSGELASDPAFIRRFEAVARTVARLAHPHVVPLIDFWRGPESAYLVMGLVPSGTLRDVMGRDEIDPETANAILQQIGSALDHAHSLGITHGGVSPDSILLDDKGNAYLADLAVTSTDRQSVGRGGRAADLAGLRDLARGLLGGSPDSEAAIARFEPEDGSSSAAELAGLIASTLHTSAEGATPTVTRNPFKGLRAFEEGEAADFYGRDGLVDSMIRTLADHRLVAVVGPSGSGKSSAVHAGLLARIADGAVSGSDGWFRVTVTPGNDPFASLAEGLQRISPSPIDSDDLAAQGIRVPGVPELVVVIDQFEELYTMVEEEDRRKAFLDLIADTAERPALGTRVICCLRADFYDRPLQHPRIGTLFRDGMVPVVPPSREEMLDMVRRPAEAVGLRFEPDLPSRIVEEVIDDPGGLPLLQYALTELVERRGDDLITSGDYARVGGVGGALVNRAEVTFDSLQPVLQEVARTALLQMVTIDEESGAALRRRVRRDELEVGAPRRQVSEILDRFIAERLLLVDRDPVTRGPTVEVAHEALLREWPRLGEWITGQEEALILARRLRAAISEWNEHDRDPGYLLSGPRLAAFSGWERRPGVEPEHPVLTTNEQGFLDASRDAEQSMNRRQTIRRRLVVGGFALAAVIATTLAVMATISRAAADESARLAFSRELAASSVNLLDDDSELSLLLALEAIETAPPGAPHPLEATTALHDALRSSRLVISKPFAGGEESGLVQASLSPDGSLLAVSEPAAGIEVWDAATGQLIWASGDREGQWSRPYFSADGAQIAVAFTPSADTSDGEVLLLDTFSGETIDVFESNTGCPWVGLPVNGAFDDSGTRLMRLVDTGGEEPGLGCFDGMLELELIDLVSAEIVERFAVAAPPIPGQPVLVLASGGKASGVLMISDSTDEQGLTRAIDLTSGELIWERPAVRSVLSPDGLTAAVYPGDGQRGVDLVDAATGETIRQLQAQGSDPASVAFSADSSKLYTTGFDGKVRAWDVLSGEVLMTLTGSGAGLGFPSPDSADTRLAAAGSDGKVLVWDLTASPLGEVMAHTIAPAQVAQWGIDTEAGLVAALGFAGRCPDQLYVGVVVDAITGEEVVPVFHDVTAQGVALSDDGGLLLHQTTFPFGPGVPCSERADGTIVAKAIGDSRQFAFDGLCDYRQPSSLLAVAGTPSGNGECPFPPERPYAEFVNDIDIGPDGLVVAGGHSSVASIWDQANGGLVRTLGPHAPGTAVQGVALDPSSGRVAVFTVGAEQRLDIYSAGGETIETIHYEPDVPMAGRIVFSPEGGMLAVAADRLTVYDTTEWKPIWEPTDAHDGGVGELDFSSNGQNIVTTGRDGFVRVWEATTGELLHSIPLGDDFGKGVGFVDDTHIVVGTQNGLIATFTIDIDELARIARDRLTREMSEQECMTYLHRSCSTAG